MGTTGPCQHWTDATSHHWSCWRTDVTRLPPGSAPYSASVALCPDSKQQGTYHSLTWLPKSLTLWGIFPKWGVGGRGLQRLIRQKMANVFYKWLFSCFLMCVYLHICISFVLTYNNKCTLIFKVQLLFLKYFKAFPYIMQKCKAHGVFKV